MGNKVECKVCGKKFSQITWRHTEKHGMSLSEYKEKFPDAKLQSEAVKEKERTNVNEVNLEPSSELAYVFGTVLGDGSAYYEPKYNRYTVKLQATDKEFVLKFKESLEELGLEPSFNSNIQHTETPQGKEYTVKMWYTTAYSKKLYKWLDDIKVEEFAKRFPWDFLGGFYDAEGNLDGRRVRISITSEGLIKDVKGILEELGFNPTLIKMDNSQEGAKKLYCLRLNRKKEAKRFYRNIEASVSRKILEGV